MKKIFTLIALLVFSSVAFAQQKIPLEAYAIIESHADIEFKDASQGIKVSASPIKKNGKKKTLVRILVPHDKDNWKDVSLKIKLAQNDIFTVAFSGIWYAKKGSKELERIMSFYDNLKIDGKPVPNGDFEEALTTQWRPTRVSFPARIVKTKDANGNFTNALRTWARTYVARDFNAEKDRWYEVSFQTKFDRIIPTNTDSESIDISKFANCSTSNLQQFGATLDASKIATEKVSLEGITFDIINPDKNNGKNAVAFRSPLAPKGLWKIAFENPPPARYIYLLHTSFYNNNNNNNNQTAELVLNMHDGKRINYALRRKQDTWLYEDPRIFTKNTMPVWFADPEKKLGKFYVSRFLVPDGNIKSFHISSANNDAFVLLGISVADKAPPMFKIKPFDKSKWTPVDMPSQVVEPNTALDQSSFFPNEQTGDKGRVIVSERGTLAFEKTPDQDARFKGFTEHAKSDFLAIPREDRPKKIAEYAQAIKRTGYNFVRGTYISGNHIYSPKQEEMIEICDLLLAEFKKNGIYVHQAIYRIPLKEHNFHMRDDIKLKVVFGDPEMWELWKKKAVDSLNHVNPYTKLALKDDPTIACFEIYNELAICFSRMDKNSRFHPLDVITPETEKLVYGKWQQWLREKYGNIKNLNDAWNKNYKPKKPYAFKTFEQVPIIIKYSDWEKCCWENLEKFVVFAKKTIRETGYKGLIVQNNLGASMCGSAVRSHTTDFTIFDTYFAHPSSFDMNGAKCSQNSAIDGLASYWRMSAGIKIDGRPNGIAEYNHCFWNKYRHELPAMFVPYSAFQNYSTLVIHETAVPYPRLNYKVISFFNVCNSPTARVSEVLATPVFIRGDVKKARKKVVMQITKDFLKNNPASAKIINGKQLNLALLTGFSASYEGPIPDTLQHVNIKKPDMTIAPEGSSEFLAEAWFHSIIENGDKSFDLAKFSQAMRQKKILNKDNITDIEKGIFQTDTNQITLNKEDLTLLVKTPRTEIAALSKRLDAQLDAMQDVQTTVPSTTAITSIDGKNITQSSRLLLIYITREANMGMQLSEDDTITAGQGDKIPALQNGILKAKIKLNPKKKFVVYPLAFNGIRRDPIPAEFKDGILNIKIDNSKLKNGSTPFFEIVAQ